MRKFSKLLAIILCLVLMVSAFSGCGEKKDDEPIVIAVAVGVYDLQSLATKDYFENYLAKELNLKFIFSGEGSTVEAVLTFIENAYSSGAQAVIDIATTSPDDVEPLAAKCDELGMYFATYYGAAAEQMQEYKTACGGVDNDNDILREQFYNLTKKILNDGKDPHSMVLCPTAARYNNLQQIASSMGAISAFNDMYNLGFTQEQMKGWIMSSSAISVPTGRSDVKIGINPLFTGDALAEFLKNGEYDFVAIAGGIYLRLEAAIADAEKTTKKNIDVLTLTNVGLETYNSFSTKDPFGNASLNSATLVSSARPAALLALVLNGVYGDIDATKVDGKAVCYTIPLWDCESAEQYEAINKLDKSNDTWIYSAEEVKQMIKKYNPDVTGNWFQKNLSETSELKAVLERRGLN